MPREARRVLYEGRVQGVGFRYTAERLARRFDVAGFVRNLDDGRVELVAEGEPSELDGLLEAVRDAMSRYIRDVTIEPIALSDAPQTEFFIRY